MKTLDDVMKAFDEKTDADFFFEEEHEKLVTHTLYDEESYPESQYELSTEKLRSFLRSSLISFAIGELEGLEVKDEKDDSGPSTVDWIVRFALVGGYNQANFEWRSLRDARLSALRKKL